jgi:hypothetical protein
MQGLQLTYAPPAKAKHLPILVLVWGGLTTLGALVGVWALNRFADTYIMGWYANRILPVGAILVGLVASSGYGIASWVIGVRIRKHLLWAILGIQVLAYFAGQYIEYRTIQPVAPLNANAEAVLAGKRPPTTGPILFRRISFPEYYHLSAINFAWSKDYGKGSGEPLGMWGYFFRLLEIVGFAAGSLIVPGVLMAAPYCDLCQIYMKTRVVAKVPTSIEARKIKKGDIEGTAKYEAEQQQAAEKGLPEVQRLHDLAVAPDPAAFGQAVGMLAPSLKDKRIDKLPSRAHISLVYCPHCHNGHLQPSVLTGHGDKVNTQKLSQIELSRDHVLAMLPHVNPKAARRVAATAQPVAAL